MTETSPLGLTVTVLRPVGAAPIVGNPSSVNSRLTVVGVIDDRRATVRQPAPVEPMPRAARHVPATAQAPAAYLRIRPMGDELMYSIEPANPEGFAPDALRPHYMAGGNFASYIDARWREAFGIGYYAIAIHDYRPH